LQKFELILPISYNSAQRKNPVLKTKKAQYNVAKRPKIYKMSAQVYATFRYVSHFISR